MGNRCESCGVFVSLETAEPEITNLELDEYDEDMQEIHFHGEMRLVRTCAECGDEMKEANIEFEGGPIDLAEHIDLCGDCPTVQQELWDNLEIEAGETEADERGEGSGRYMKTFIIGKLNWEISCPDCDFTAEGTIEAEEQASYFEDLY